jgi:hypothetical protein
MDYTLPYAVYMRVSRPRAQRVHIYIRWEGVIYKAKGVSEIVLTIEAAFVLACGIATILP